MTTIISPRQHMIHPFGIIWRSLIVGVAYVVLTIGAGMLNSMLGVNIDVSNFRWRNSSGR